MKKKLLVGGAVILVLFGILFKLSTGSSSSDPLRSTGDKFTKAIITSNTKLSYSMLSKKITTSTTQADWEKSMLTVKDYYSKTVYKVTKEIIPKTKTSNGRANLIYQATGKNGSKRVFTVEIDEGFDGNNSVSGFSVEVGEYNATK